MAKAKILVIDHDNDLARLLSELLLRENYDVLTSRTPTEALKLLLGIGQPLRGRLLLLDALAMEWRLGEPTTP